MRGLFHGILSAQKPRAINLRKQGLPIEYFAGGF